MYFVLLAVMMRWRLGDLDDGRVIRTALKTLIAGAVMAGGLYVASVVIGTLWLSGFWATLARLSALSIFGLALFVLVSYILRSEDLLTLSRDWKRKLSSRPSEPLEKIE